MELYNILVSTESPLVSKYIYRLLIISGYFHQKFIFFKKTDLWINSNYQKDNEY